MRIAAAIVGSDFTVEVRRLAHLRLGPREELQAATDVIQGEQ